LRRLKQDEKAIEYALKNLPEKLEDVYIRIFELIPKEDWPFVRHTLRWIYVYNVIHNGRSIAVQTILESFEHSIINQPVKYRFYDENSLKDVCGCLVRISYGPVMGYDHLGVIATGASYAHYTVREFLEDYCVRESPVASFGISWDSVLVESLETALIHATKTPIQWDDSHFGAPLDAAKPYANIAVLQWPIYVAVCAACSLSSLPPHFIKNSSDRLWNLYQLLLQQWFDSTERLLCMRRCSEVFLKELRVATTYVFADIVSPTWQKPLSTLVPLLFLGESNNFILADWFLQSMTDYIRILEQPILFTMPHSLHGSDCSEDKDYEFGGSLVEVFAQLSQSFPNSFQFLLDKDAPTSDPTSLLLSHLGVHVHLEEYTMCEYCPDLCGRLIRLGASVKGEGYQVTPLQMAAYNVDVDAVKLLLGKGADPNGIGNPDGIQWGERNILHRYNVLAGVSPLGCCLRVENEYADRVSEISDGRSEIANLLHKERKLCLSSERRGSENEDGGDVDEEEEEEEEEDEEEDEEEEEEEEEEGYEEGEDEDEEIQDDLGPSGGGERDSADNAKSEVAERESSAANGCARPLKRARY